MRIQHWLAMAMLCSVLAGCGTQLLYNKLDWLMLFKIERFVDLNDAQEQRLKQVFKDFHDWHRQTQLPTYVAWLAAARQRLADPIDVDFWEQITDDGKVLAERARQYLLPAMVATAASLSDNQIDELLDEIADKRKEHAEVIEMTPKERVKKRVKEMRKYARRWLGRLSQQQQVAIEAWAPSLEPFEEQLFEANLQWERDIRAALTKRQDLKHLASAVDVLTAVDADRVSAELDALLDRNQVRTYQLLSGLVNGASAKQRQHLFERLDDYQRDFAELSGGAELAPNAAAGLGMLRPPQ